MRERDYRVAPVTSKGEITVPEKVGETLGLHCWPEAR